MLDKLMQPEVLGILCVLLGYSTNSKAVELMQSCMDKHGSVYSASSCYNDKGELRDVTPEYMYTDRETQRLQMILNNLTAQAQENIARAGAGLPDVSSTNMNNSQEQAQSSRSNSNANSNSNSASRSNSSSTSSNNNANINSNSSNSFSGVFN